MARRSSEVGLTLNRRDAIASGLLALLGTGCGILEQPGKPETEKQQADVLAVVNSFVGGGYSLREMRWIQGIPNNDPEVMARIEYHQNPRDPQPLHFAIRGRYVQGRINHVGLTMSGGLYQPAAGGAIYNVTKADQRITPTQLEQVARVLLNLGAGVKAKPSVSKYSWGDIPALEFDGRLKNGARIKGTFDSKGQGEFDIYPNFPTDVRITLID